MIVPLYYFSSFPAFCFIADQIPFTLCPSHMRRFGLTAATSRFRDGLCFQLCSVIPGHFPTEGAGASGHPDGWELRRGHHLQSSVGLHTPFQTACGRLFDPQLYYEVLQACCDQQWMGAIQREIQKDSEYVTYLRQHGGAAKALRILTENTHHDDEFMNKLREQLKTDVKVSLTLCAVQDSYRRIREKRDDHETQVVADGGRDPYASMRAQQNASFGTQQPRF